MEAPSRSIERSDPRNALELSPMASPGLISSSNYGCRVSVQFPFASPPFFVEYEHMFGKI